jgi:hypothetical protein
MAAGLATAWWGPGGRNLRSGTRTVVRSVVRGRVGRTAVACLCVMIALAVLIVAGREGFAPDWAPFTPPPVSSRIDTA